MSDHQPHPAAKTKRPSQAHVFDGLVERYGTVFNDKPEQVRAGTWLIEQLGPGTRVLDVGCGNGLPTARQLTDAGIHVVGIDISPAMVAAATTTVPEATIHRTDILDLTDTGFDAAVAFFSLLMLPRSDIARALSILHKAIKPGGYLVISMVETDLDYTPIQFLATEVHVSGYPRDELRHVVEQAGFEIMAMRVIDDHTPNDSQVEPETELYLFAQRTHRTAQEHNS